MASQIGLSAPLSAQVQVKFWREFWLGWKFPKLKTKADVVMFDVLVNWNYKLTRCEVYHVTMTSLYREFPMPRLIGCTDIFCKIYKSAMYLSALPGHSSFSKGL